MNNSINGFNIRLDTTEQRISEMEVPRLGVQSELHCQPQPQQIQAMSATYTTAHGNTGSLITEQGQGSNLQPHGS